MMHPYFKNSLVSLYYNKEAGIGMAVWQGHVQGADFREAVLLCLELMVRFELRGWLSDNRKVEAIDLNDLQWSLEVIASRIAAMPLLRMARLPSEVDEIRNAVEKTVAVIVNKGQNSAGNQLHRSFGQEQEAIEWLTAITGLT